MVTRFISHICYIVSPPLTAVLFFQTQLLAASTQPQLFLLGLQAPVPWALPGWLWSSLPGFCSRDPQRVSESKSLGNLPLSMWPNSAFQEHWGGVGFWQSPALGQALH